MPTTPVATRQKLSEEEYLAMEDAAEFKSEFYDGEMFAMSGGSYDHSVIATNTTTYLQIRLQGRPCRPLNTEMRLHVPESTFYAYPDASVVCGPPQYAAKSTTTIINPTVIVEVLSPSTERYDRTAKFWNYQKLATLQEYLLITQDAPQVERFSRQADQWFYTACKGLNASVSLPGLGIEIPLRELYEGVEFPSSGLTNDETPV